MPDSSTTLRGASLETSGEKSYLQLEIQELMGNPPGWLMYSGNSIVFICVFFLGFMSFFIKYPDKLEASVLIESKKPPIEVISQGLFVIDSLLIENGHEVEAGRVLAILKNTAKFDDVKRLENWIKAISPKIGINQKRVAIPPISPDLQLGTLHTNYADLLQLIDEYNYFQQLADTEGQIMALEREIERIKKLNKVTTQQQSLFSKELEFQKRTLDRAKELHLIGALSEENLELKQAEWFQMERQKNLLKAEHIQNEIRLEQLAAQKNRLVADEKNDQNSRIIKLLQQIKQMKAALENWRATYLITAPINGQISFAAEIAEKQAIRDQELIFTILPPIENNNYLARCEVPVQGVGKFEIGTPVLIYLDAYPYKEFGILKTEVSQIAVIPQKNKKDQLHYQITSILPDTLTTSYRQEIPFQQKLSGKAVLISEDKSILERIFQQLFSLLQ